MTEKRSGDISQ